MTSPSPTSILADVSSDEGAVTAILAMPETSLMSDPATQVAVGPNQNETISQAPLLLNESRPPLKYMHLGPNDRLPPIAFPSTEEERDSRVHADDLINAAFTSKHEYSPAAFAKLQGSGSKDLVSSFHASAVAAAQKYQELMNLLSSRSSTPLLKAVLHCLITSNRGRNLDRLVTHSKVHANLIHTIMKLDPFIPPEVNKLRQLDKMRKERKVQRRLKDEELSRIETAAVGNIESQDTLQSTTQGSNSQSTVSTLSLSPRRNVQIAESSIRQKELKHITPALPYYDYSIADIYLKLLVTLVGNNNILSMSVIRAIWGMLVDFDPNWKSWSADHVQQKRQERLRLRLLARQNAHEAEPSAKRMKIGDGKLARHESSCDDDLEQERNVLQNRSQEKHEVEELEPEEERPVPGTGGLSVEFVRDSFIARAYSDNDVQVQHDADEEYVCSDRLAMLRVRRLLLALLNIFRLAPRSKSDLQREISINFPYYKTSPQQVYQWYLFMCSQMIHLVPTFEGPMLALFVDKALEMDVEIKISDGGCVTLDDNAEESRSLLAAGGASLSSSLEHATKKRSIQQVLGSAKSESNSPSVQVQHDEEHYIHEMSERLDTLMCTLYERIIDETKFNRNSLSGANHGRAQCQAIVRAFGHGVRIESQDYRQNDALSAVGLLVAKRDQQQSDNKSSASISSLAANEIIVGDAPPINITDPLYRGFIAKLIDCFFDPDYSGDVPRQTVVCYLASFVSRSTYVCPETVCECIAALLRWTEIYISAHRGTATATASGGKLRRHSSAPAALGSTKHLCEVHTLFYTACQAAYYIMCFRGYEAVKYYRLACAHKDDNESPYADPESVDIGPKRWRQLCGHELQPLKYCLESVRHEFLLLADELNLFFEAQDLDDAESEIQLDADKKFIKSLWDSSEMKDSNGKEKNMKRPTGRRRSRIISTAATQEKKRLDGGVGGLGRGSNPLNSFFPFDPYLLQQSFLHVNPYYRNWEDCILTVDDEDKETGVVLNDDSSLEEISDREQEDGQDSDSDDGIEETNTSKKSPHSRKGISVSLGDAKLEMEIRRSRALSSGSQCSW
ncbi:hypothetical protein THAOC_14237 [Thalassiosira oceanica]|uniref:Uncharacterized protein n=1 Tax=Thalassiosira oceanica TaxID=159749 RepID=K0SHW2_THAOC|nr:hypothetical protein THAOC_14237 [Thalassiosira oceanica]|eukprot:EJK64970.1 hypothetical protein THAOC_14237 [Thalassiosira oceanica]